MYPLYESKIVRSIGVIAFGIALTVSVVIIVNSGILGGNGSGSASSGSDEVIDSASTVPAESTGTAAPAPATGTRTHVVAGGDSFYSIARKYNVTISEIQRLNANVDPQNLTTGLKLSIP